MSARTLKVLLIEDSAQDAELIRSSLSFPGDIKLSITHRERLSTALATLTEQTIDVIIADLNLPDAQDLDTVRALRQACSTPIVVLSSVYDDETRLAARKLGVAEFVNKWKFDGAAIARTLLYVVERDRQQRLLRDVAEAHVDATLVLREDLEIIFANRTAQSILGEGERPLVGSTFDIPLDFERPVEFRRSLHGEERHFEAKSASIEFEGERVTLTSIRETTDRIKNTLLQRKLMHADRLASVGQLASGVAHEINNPATFITTNHTFMEERLEGLRRFYSGLLEITNAPEDPTEALKELLRAHQLPMQLGDLKELISDNASGMERITRIVKELGQFSRFDGDEIELADFSEIIAVASNITRNEIRHRAVLSVNCSSGVVLSCNRGRLIQVITNLLVNAAQSIEPGAAKENKIEINVEEMGNALRLTVQDTGRGISKEDRALIFEPFFTTKAQGVGTGLGLTLSAEIVRQHRGTIQCYSEVGQGTRFEISLPFENGLELTPTKQVEATPDFSERYRLLLIDDDQRVAKALARLMTKSCEVVIASSSEEGLELLEKDSGFDVVVCDIMMPDMDGVDFFTKVEARWPHLASSFVFVSGGVFTSKAQAFLKTTSLPYLDKPVDFQRLHQLIDTLARQRPQDD